MKQTWLLYLHTRHPFRDMAALNLTKWKAICQGMLGRRVPDEQNWVSARLHWTFLPMLKALSWDTQRRTSLYFFYTLFYHSSIYLSSSLLFFSFYFFSFIVPFFSFPSFCLYIIKLLYTLSSFFLCCLYFLILGMLLSFCPLSYVMFSYLSINPYHSLFHLYLVSFLFFVLPIFSSFSLSHWYKQRAPTPSLMKVERHQLTN